MKDDMAAVAVDTRTAPPGERTTFPMFQSAKLDDVLKTLQCADAADAVARVDLEEGQLGWMARAT